jgi:hypothetical protein
LRGRVWDRDVETQRKGQKALNMPEERIQVISYSGYRGEETPRVMIFQNIKIEVLEILSQWVEEEFEDRTRKRFFKVKGSDGDAHTIYYDEKVMEWFHRFKD